MTLAGRQPSAKIEVFQNNVKLQGQGHNVKIEKSCHKEYTWNIKALPLTRYGIKVITNVKVFQK